MHAKQRNPSRIQAQEVAQKGPECDAKVCLTRPSNPLKTLGPGLNSCLTFRISAMHAKRHPDEEKVNRAVDGK